MAFIIVCSLQDPLCPYLLLQKKKYLSSNIFNVVPIDPQKGGVGLGVQRPVEMKL